MDLSFFNGRKVLVTGHTGFKGTWLSKILIHAGADVMGYSLEPQSAPNLHDLSCIADHMSSIIGDIRDYEKLCQVFFSFRPEIVLHLAAQPIVRESYKDPRYTYEINVMGTVNVLECIRQQKSVRSFVNITTDKVYHNQEWHWGYRENEFLNGHDPYSNSKSCSELVTDSFRKSFFTNGSVAISTARAGNVIGGGDFASDRIVPDCVRAALEKRQIVVRNPNSIRPYQHVLEPLFAYLQIAHQQYINQEFSGAYNVGPDDKDCVTTKTLVDSFCRHWGEELTWNSQSDDGPHEANFLKLDCSKIKNIFNWQPRWSIDEAIQKTVEWTRTYQDKGNIAQLMEKQTSEYMKAN